MTMAADKQDKVLNFSSEREQSGACSSSAEREKNQGKNFLNVPTLRFPEFSGEWKKCKLGDIMEFTKERISTSLLTEDNYVSTENISTTLNLYVHPNMEQKKKCINQMFKALK